MPSFPAVSLSELRLCKRSATNCHAYKTITLDCITPTNPSEIFDCNMSFLRYSSTVEYAIIIYNSCSKKERLTQLL